MVKKGTRSSEVDEDAMKSAIEEVFNKTLSIRKSAQKYGVKPTTLESRLSKINKQVAGEEDNTVRVFSSKYSSNQVFTAEEEIQLNTYILNCSKMHYGLTIVQVRKLAYEFAKAKKLRYPHTWDHNKMAGKDWLDSFRKRHTNLSLRKPENTSAARCFSFNKTAVNDFYGNLEKVYTKYKFTADRIFNFDESGISTVLNTPKVLAEKNQKQIGQLVSAERGELVTFGGIISAGGNTIPPLFIFPRVHFKDHFMTGAPEGSLGIATKSGWINSGIFLEVLKHIQKKSSCSKDNPILLLVDNHESHVTIEAVDYARDNGIVYLSFPPHTTHRLQPLDVGIFGPFKAKLKTAFNDWHVNNPGKTLNIYNIPQLAKLAYFESFTGKNITSAFEKTGIWPFNKLAFSDDDFAAVSVYHSGSTSGPDVSVVQTNTEEVEQQDIPPGLAHTSSSLLPLPLEPAQGGQSSSTVDQGFPQSSVSASPPLPTPTTPPASLSAVTPEVVRPYPEVDRNAPKKSNKGRQPGKSRIYTDTPEKTRLEEIEKAKQLKKQELERKQKVKEMKRALSLSGKQKRQKKTVNIAKPKRQKKALKPNSENETDSEEGANVSLRESSCSPIQEMSEESDFQDETPVMSVNIKEGCFILVKFEKKRFVLYYVGQVLKKYSPTEYNVSFLRKKSGTWKFVFPSTKDEGTVYISDIVHILSPSKSALTARTAHIFSFEKDLSMYNVG
ncbi:uncharacterized protein [Choristoneura fumiferana]|uniref:uncharacterized protein n=1 Tax=Choristoneura fumiferana TaxID=7141 RepID=UPI003D15429F